MSDDLHDYPHHSEIKSYLDAYTDAFGLRQHIQFRNAVQHARRLTGGGWELQTQDGETRH